MFTLVRTKVFDVWLDGLADIKARARIVARLRSAALGNLDDCAPIGGGLSEMRVHVGPGYRVYFVKNGKAIYVVLAGGDKSTQKRDIVMAKELALAVKETDHGA